MPLKTNIFLILLSAAPYIYSQTMLRSSRSVFGAVLRGIDPRFPVKIAGNPDKKILGKMSESDIKGNIPGIILGKELALNLGVFQGDSLYLVSPRGIVSPVGYMPSMKKFEVIGIFESGMYEYDGAMAYISLSQAQKILRMGKKITGIQIRVKNIDHAANIGKKIVAHLGDSYEAKDWMQMNLNFFSALKLEKTAMFVILSLIVLVAAFNIASSLAMIVMEKTRDIAILKTMGATDKSIRKIFVFKGMAIGYCGTFSGVFLGTLLCFLLSRYKFVSLPPSIYYITELPVLLEFFDVLIIAVSAIIICFLATLFPSNQASSLDPIEAIRYG
ncbi:ABC transporter permease [Desulfobacterales bacterium HSG17]|nr:ABC transporter permease [Desulfobacterales bacterium HSG17]